MHLRSSLTGMLFFLFILFTVALAARRLVQGDLGLTRQQIGVLAALLLLAVLNSAWPGLTHLLRDPGASDGAWVVFLSLGIAAFAVWVGDAGMGRR